MRILQVQNRYQGGLGGEDRLMDKEYRLLHTRGHEVHQFIAHNGEIGLGLSKLRAALRMFFSKHDAHRVARPMPRTASLLAPYISMES